MLKTMPSKKMTPTDPRLERVHRAVERASARVSQMNSAERAGLDRRGRAIIAKGRAGLLACK